MEAKQEIRPVIPNAKINASISEAELFQNTVVRPIIKLQHSLIILLFNNYLEHSKFNLNRLELTKKNEFIRTAITKNTNLKNQYIGLITGLFTETEFQKYLENATEHNRRIVQMIVQRLQNTL